MRLPKIIEGIKIMKYQCAECGTIFEHEKYLTECEGEKVCPICETVEPVYKLRNPHERVVKPTLAEMDKMWINYVDNTLQIEFEELMKKHNKCVKGRKGVPREVSDYLASYYNDLIEINNSKCSL